MGLFSVGELVVQDLNVGQILWVLLLIWDLCVCGWWFEDLGF